MKHLVLSIVLCVAGVGLAWADDQPFFGTPTVAAVLQNPSGVINSASSAVSTLQPSIEEIYDFRHSTWTTGSAVALWTFSSRQIPLASLKAGYGLPATIYGEVKIDAQGITKRYLIPIVPEQVRSVLTYGVLNDAWGVVGKYGHLGVVVGYDVAHHDTNDKMGGLVVGVSLGGQLAF